MQTCISKRWWFLQLIESLALVMGACVAEGLRLSYLTFNSTEGFSLLAPDKPFYNGSDPSFEEEAIWLTPDPRSTTLSDLLALNVGRFVYRQPISFMPDRGASNTAVASFNTSFSFQIITTGSYGSCGDGFSFFVAPSAEPPIGSYGYFLGLANGSVQADPHPHFFAVEFDTYENFEVNDSSSRHIAININSLISVASTDTGPAASAHNDSFPELDLYRNYTFTAWVAYSSSTHLIEVWATNSSRQNAQRPSSPCVQIRYDLSAVFQEEMYVGFSAACGAAYAGHILYSWDFSMEEVGTTGLNAPTVAPREEGFGDGDTLEKQP